MSGYSHIVKKYKCLSEKVKASLWFLVCSFLQRGISVITTPIFTRLLSTAEYGKYNVFNSWFGIIAIVVSLRLSYGVYSQGLVKFEPDRNRFSSSMQGLNFSLCLLWTLLYFFTKNTWNALLGLTTTQMLSMLVMIWATNVFEFWAAEQRVTYSYRLLVIITILVSLAKPIVGIILVLNAEDKVTARILGLVLVELIAYSGFFIVQLRRGKSFFSKKYWKYALLFNIPLIPHYLSQTVLNNSDRIMISSMVGESEAGIYGLAYSLATLMLLVSTSLSHTITPWIYQRIKSEKIEDIPNVVYTSLILLASANMILIAFAPEIVYIFAPRSYHDAIWVIPPVAMSVFFIYGYDVFSKFAFYYDKTKQIMIASLIGAVLNVLLNYIFIKLYGFVAAGYTTLFCYILYAALHYCLMNRIISNVYKRGSIYSTKALLAISVCFMALGFAYLLSYRCTIIRYIITLLLISISIVKRKYILSKIRSVLHIRPSL